MAADDSTVDISDPIQAKLASRQSRIPPNWRLPESITSRANRNASISAFSLLNETNILTDTDRRITEDYDATSLSKLLATGKLSSLQVTTAFCKRAAIAHQLTNCLTEIFFDEAIERAKECDEYLAWEGNPMGPFHGLPISLKDSFMVKGQFATMGFSSYLTKPTAGYNSVVVDVLLESGAVLYCKTNIPQGLLSMDSENVIFGRTLNPHKLSLTPSGSSSGEGALVGFRGSILGVGTDVGGSVRSPALVSGCFGFKPTANRIPYFGQQLLFPKGYHGVTPSVGPLAHSARDLTLFCRTIIQGETWKRDPTAASIPWRDVPKRRLTIGVWEGSDSSPLFPPVSHTLRSATAAVEAAGHTVRIIKVPEAANPLRGLGIFFNSFALDPNRTLMKLLEDANEEFLPQTAAVRELLNSYSPCDLQDVWKVNANRFDFRGAWHKIWTDNAIDVLLCPGSEAPAVPHQQGGSPAYTALWNLLDFPASVVPYLKADKSVHTQSMVGYDAIALDGAPCGVQVVGYTGKDEEVLMATEVIEEALHASGKEFDV